MLGRGGGYDVNLLGWHQWVGFGVAGACLAAWILHWRGLRVTYGVVLGLAFVGLVVTGHFGGSLTHGSDYLTRVAQGSGGGRVVRNDGRPLGGGAEDSVFARLVMPVMRDKCVSCHGPAKARGGLRLDSLDAMFKGRRGADTAQARQAAEGKFIRTLRLPDSNDGHMPPAGRPQLTADEIAMLVWWVGIGAPGEGTAEDLKLPDNLRHLLTERRK